MKILSVDTSTKYLCVGLYADSRFYEYTLEVGTRLSALITPSITRILDAAGYAPDDIDYYACGIGPGSFTGLRVGVATVKGMAWALHKPVVQIPTLDTIAMNAIGQGTYLMPIVDAKRGLVYTSTYQVCGRCVRRIAPYALLSIDACLKALKGQTAVLGDGLPLFNDRFFLHKPKTIILDKDYWYPKASSLLAQALEKIKKRQLSNAFVVNPLYLYPKECQVRKERHEKK